MTEVGIEYGRDINVDVTLDGSSGDGIVYLMGQEGPSAAGNVTLEGPWVHVDAPDPGGSDYHGPCRTFAAARVLEIHWEW